VRRNKDNIKKISEICNYLSDRDVGMKEEYSLLKKIIEDLPINILAFKINKDFIVTKQIGKYKDNLSGSRLSDHFGNDSDFISKISISINGEKTNTFFEIDSEKFECINTPIHSEDGTINSVLSIAWRK
jgi:hypothetical protein